MKIFLLICLLFVTVIHNDKVRKSYNNLKFSDGQLLMFLYKDTAQV